MGTWAVVVIMAAAAAVAAGEDAEAPPSLCQRVSQGSSSVRHVGCISEALVPQNGTYEVQYLSDTVFIMTMTMTMMKL